MLLKQLTRKWTKMLAFFQNSHFTIVQEGRFLALYPWNEQLLSSWKQKQTSKAKNSFTGYRGWRCFHHKILTNVENRRNFSDRIHAFADKLAKFWRSVATGQNILFLAMLKLSLSKLKFVHSRVGFFLIPWRPDVFFNLWPSFGQCRSKAFEIVQLMQEIKLIDTEFPMADLIWC